jgi:hypothetical protein
VRSSRTEFRELTAAVMDILRHCANSGKENNHEQLNCSHTSPLGLSASARFPEMGIHHDACSRLANRTTHCP